MKLASNKNKSFWPYSNNKCINIFQWKKSFVFSKKKMKKFFLPKNGMYMPEKDNKFNMKRKL